ncbi:MAG TPA: DUF4115 domain-containing protein [Smithellaceae bacterium]|nr:DUF4115 domain-containing protein [Smithellaceae bacterium]
MDARNNSDGACAALKEKREAAGLELKTVFQRTRLSVDILEAIENGDFHLLPVPVYTRNFIKIYSRALDMDSQPVLDSYEAYLCSLKPVEPCPKEENPREKPDAGSGRRRNFLWTAAIAVIVLLAVWFISLQYKPADDSSSLKPGNITAPQDKSTDSMEPALELPDMEPVINVDDSAVNGGKTKETEKKTAAEKSVAKPVAAAVKPTVKEQSSQAASVKKEMRAAAAPVPVPEESAVLVISATEETWLRIKTDREQELQFLLQPGDKIERKAAVFELDIGNAGGVKLQYKGKVIENLGESGQVIHMRLPE